VNQTLIAQLAAQEETLKKMHAAHLGQVAQYASNNAQALADAAKLAFETIAPALIAETKVPIDRITMQLQDAAETMKRAAVSIETENVEQRDFLREVSDAYLNANK
jgi:Tfp pilus assembly protein PilV